MRFYRKEAGTGRGVFFNGVNVQDDTDKRGLYRWIYEDDASQIGFFRADDLLTRYGLTMDDFFQWALDEGRKVWYTNDPGKIREYESKYGGGAG